MPKITLKVPLGQPTLNQKKAKLKLLKKVKKGTKESKLSLGSWLAFRAANVMCTNCWILSFKTENKNLTHTNYEFSLKCHAKRTISLKLDLECL